MEINLRQPLDPYLASASAGDRPCVCGKLRFDNIGDEVRSLVGQELDLLDFSPKWGRVGNVACPIDRGVPKGLQPVANSYRCSAKDAPFHQTGAIRRVVMTERFVIVEV